MTTTTVPYAAAVTPDCDTTRVLVVGALTGPLTLANPTGSPADGQRLDVQLAQDAVGSRAVTVGTSYRGPVEMPVPAAVCPFARFGTLLQLQWSASAGKWNLLGFSHEPPADQLGLDLGATLDEAQTTITVTQRREQHTEVESFYGDGTSAGRDMVITQNAAGQSVYVPRFLRVEEQGGRVLLTQRVSWTA